MADESDEESWESFFVNNRLIPLHDKRRGREEGESVPYRLNLKYVEGIPIPDFAVSLLKRKHRVCRTKTS